MPIARINDKAHDFNRGLCRLRTNDWCFIAGNSDTCIAEILADTSIGTTCF